MQMPYVELNHSTLEDRVQRIENQLARLDKLVDGIVEMAKDHPVGKMILKALGI